MQIADYKLSLGYTVRLQLPVLHKDFFLINISCMSFKGRFLKEATS